MTLYIDDFGCLILCISGMAGFIPVCGFNDAGGWIQDTAHPGPPF